MRSLSDSLTSDCFGELLDPERRVDGGALARVGVEDDEPVGAVGPAAVQDLVLEVAAKGNNKRQMCHLCNLALLVAELHYDLFVFRYIFWCTRVSIQLTKSVPKL